MSCWHFAGVLVQLERGTERLADAPAKEMWQDRVAWMRLECANEALSPCIPSGQSSTDDFLWL